MKTFVHIFSEKTSTGGDKIGALILLFLTASISMNAQNQIPVSFANKSNCTMTIHFAGCNGPYVIPSISPNSSYFLIMDPGDSPQVVKADFPGGVTDEITSTADGNCSSLLPVIITPNSCFTNSYGIVKYTALPPYPPIQYSFEVW